MSKTGVEYYSKHPKVTRLETVEPMLLKLERELGLVKRKGHSAQIKKSEAKSWLYG
jgi:hypothetical protein